MMLRYKISSDIGSDSTRLGLYRINMFVEHEERSERLKAFTGEVGTFALNKNMLKQTAGLLCDEPQICEIAAQEVYNKRKDFWFRLNKGLIQEFGLKWNELTKKAGIKLDKGCIYLTVNTDVEPVIQEKVCKEILFRMTVEVNAGIKEICEVTSSLSRKYIYLNSWIGKYDNNTLFKEG